MPSFPDPDQMLNALNRTREALGISADAALGADEAGVFLKYLLLAGLDGGETRYWRGRPEACAPLRRHLEALLGDILAALAGGAAPAPPGLDWTMLGRRLLAAPNDRRRLVELALEAVLSEPLAPELCLQFAPAALPADALPGTRHHAVIFAAGVCFSHEFYPLAVDACVHDAARHGWPRINVVGAHQDWLTEDGRLGRIIYLDFNSEQLIETDLAVPLRPNSVQFLCLGAGEQEKHAALSPRFTCVQVNPSAPARLADDKAATLVAWSALGLATPACQAIAPGDVATALRFLQGHAEIAVKPNQATEGELVAFFRRDDPQAPAALARHLERCWDQGVAIAQQRRDGVGFRQSAAGVTQTLTLRLNLAFDGERQRLESAYAQLGQDARSPAARGRGGRVVALDEALAGLVVREAGDEQPLRLDAEAWRGIRAQAEKAAGVFEGLLLVGLDVLLDQDRDGNIIPVFLEANPRPAGLSHSRLCAADPFAPSPIGVSLNLWNCLDGGIGQQ